MFDTFPFGSPNMTRMPSLPRLALGLAPAALVLALVVCWPALAGAPGAFEVTIVKPDGEQVSILLPTADDDLSGIYRIRQADGSVKTVDATGGVSVYSLLKKARVSGPRGYEAVQIPRPNGETITLTRNAVESSEPRPPGFFTDDATGKTMFVGFPLAGSREVPARDYFEISKSGLRITQVDKAEASVKLKASRTKIDPGEKVKFTATVSPKGSYRYDWALEPGVDDDDAGPSNSHRFKKAGKFKVVVTVYAGDAGGEPAGFGGVEIQVGDQKKSDKDRDGGGNNTADGAPSSGTTTGSSGAGTYDSGPAYTPVPSTPPPATPPATSQPDPPDIATSGTPVEGNLLADVSEPPPTNILESAARAARDGNKKDDKADDGDVGVSEAAVSVFAALALLALGAGIETRQGRLPRLRLPRRAG